jgi:hypothetical protein
MFYSFVVELMAVKEIHSPICTYNASTREVFAIQYAKVERRLAELRERVRKYLNK